MRAMVRARAAETRAPRLSCGEEDVVIFKKSGGGAKGVIHGAELG
jgi:hypothetical protein